MAKIHVMAIHQVNNFGPGHKFYMTDENEVERLKALGAIRRLDEKEPEEVDDEPGDE